MSEQKNEFRNLVGELKEAFETKNQEAIDRINEAMDKLEGFESKTEAIESKLDDLEFKMQGGFKKPEEKSLEIKNEFLSHFQTYRSGSRGELANLEVKSDYHYGIKNQNMVRYDFGSAGALLMPAEISADIIRKAIEATPAMQLVRVTPVSSSDYKRNRRVSTPGGRWLGEAKQNQRGKIEYDQISIPPHKWAAEYGHSVEMGDDTAYDLVSEITDAYREDFNYDVGNAVLNGDGKGKPLGMIGRITNFDATQLAITTDDLIRMQEAIKDTYKANANWLFTRQTRAYIRTLILSSTNGLQYTWEPNFKVGAPTLLLGAPVNIANENDLAGRVEGNFTAGQVYAIYGDFNRGYEVSMHTDMYMIDNPYSEASSFVHSYHIMSRIGGAPILPEALVQITASGS